MRSVMANRDMKMALELVRKQLDIIGTDLSDLHERADGPYRNWLKTVFSNVDASVHSLDGIIQNHLQ